MKLHTPTSIPEFGDTEIKKNRPLDHGSQLPLSWYRRNTVSIAAVCARTAPLWLTAPPLPLFRLGWNGILMRQNTRGVSKLKGGRGLRVHHNRWPAWKVCADKDPRSPGSEVVSRGRQRLAVEEFFLHGDFGLEPWGWMMFTHRLLFNSYFHHLRIVLVLYWCELKPPSLGSGWTSYFGICNCVYTPMSSQVRRTHYPNCTQIKLRLGFNWVPLSLDGPHFHPQQTKLVRSSEQQSCEYSCCALRFVVDLWGVFRTNKCSCYDVWLDASPDDRPLVVMMVPLNRPANGLCRCYSGVFWLPNCRCQVGAWFRALGVELCTNQRAWSCTWSSLVQTNS